MILLQALIRDDEKYGVHYYVFSDKPTAKNFLRDFSDHQMVDWRMKDSSGFIDSKHGDSWKYLPDVPSTVKAVVVWRNR